MNKSVDNYFIDGCGRCPLGGTSDCKVHNWTEELELLRDIANSCGLNEESKWGVPCYTFNKKNVLIVSAFKEFAAISFFKGALLSDNKKILEKPGKNSQAARYMKFTNVTDIKSIQDEIKSYIFEAIEVEKAGLKLEFKKNPEPLPQELEDRFEEDPTLKSAFDNLTPGRQRGYIIYFSQPKQSTTRIKRIEKCIPKILSGEGLHDKYSSSKKRSQ